MIIHYYAIPVHYASKSVHGKGFGSFFARIFGKIASKAVAKTAIKTIAKTAKAAAKAGLKTAAKKVVPLAKEAVKEGLKEAASFGADKAKEAIQNLGQKAIDKGANPSIVQNITKVVETGVDKGLTNVSKAATEKINTQLDKIPVASAPSTSKKITKLNRKRKASHKKKPAKKKITQSLVEAL